MDKREALAVLEEINGACRKDWVMSCFMLNRPSSAISKTVSGKYQLKMKCELDNSSRKCLKPIIEKYKLSMQEERGYFVLFRG